jgi:hypothetical protein
MRWAGHVTHMGDTFSIGLQHVALKVIYVKSFCSSLLILVYKYYIHFTLNHQATEDIPLHDGNNPHSMPKLKTVLRDHAGR